jgi:hypothetical protein
MNENNKKIDNNNNTNLINIINKKNENILIDICTAGTRFYTILILFIFICSILIVFDISIIKDFLVHIFVF